MVSRQQHKRATHDARHRAGPGVCAHLRARIKHRQPRRCAQRRHVRFDILLAENTLVNKKLAVKILEKYGHTVEIVENGSLAVDAFKSRVAQNKQFDILMDVSMPFMGGMEATELIRLYEMRRGLMATPIIALTAHAMIGDRERCIQAGMDDHITKPLRRGDLLNAIGKLAGERR